MNTSTAKLVISSVLNPGMLSVIILSFMERSWPALCAFNMHMSGGSGQEVCVMAKSQSLRATD